MSRKKANAEHILALVHELKPVLVNNGIVHERKEPGRRAYWQLRYRARCPDKGYIIHRRLSLGSDQELALRVKELIEQWRNDVVLERQAQQAARLKQREEQELKAKYTTSLAFLIGGSGRYMRRVRKELCSMLESDNPVSPMKFVWQLHTTGRVKRRPVGRPHRNNLW